MNASRGTGGHYNYGNRRKSERRRKQRSRPSWRSRITYTQKVEENVDDGHLETVKWCLGSQGMPSRSIIRYGRELCCWPASWPGINFAEGRGNMKAEVIASITASTLSRNFIGKKYLKHNQEMDATTWLKSLASIGSNLDGLVYLWKLTTQNT